MGQGQLLIIILGVIVVGIAIAVGISMFQGDQPQAEAVEFYGYSSTIERMGYIRQWAENSRDSATGKYQSADSIIAYFANKWSTPRNPWAAKLFRMDSASVKWAKLGAIGIWVCPDESTWCKISAFGPHGELIATTDNFNEGHSTIIE